ncbi:BMP family lipoprotein [Zhihengliuella salsuginis]|uniref:BMP family ABC transporter substrate-binding protein n=1 Tax=Zhihengliuella salsuginis TaxID=578222 RepID=A0ABQ3GKQ2_9MICC|nr:BMP family ABC transporter substrate-binding protein [Zhihengliuella salsuginis]GHD09455.1 BMP family ABC transporter substrate-binding protein [Zhihengliuella salsuginis]
MKNSLRIKRSTGAAAAILGASALVLTACGSAPEEGGSGAAEEIDYTACMVSDEGGFDDGSFNQASHEGLLQAESELGVQTREAESNSSTDMGPNVNQMVDAGCDMIVTAGFKFEDLPVDAAEANPETNFVVVDYGYEELPENMRTLNYNTAEAAYLAGYTAAAYSKTGKVGTFGGGEIPTVTDFMFGFEQGVMKYNEDKGAEVEVEGMDTFVGDFSNTVKAKQISENFLNSDVDVIMPVAGPLGQTAVDAVNESANEDDAVVWVDTDGHEYANGGDTAVLTSVMKNMGLTVFESIEMDVNDEFASEAYVGTLENEGVGIAPFYEFESELPDGLQGELDALKEQIIAGEIDPLG